MYCQLLFMSSVPRLPQTSIYSVISAHHPIHIGFFQGAHRESRMKFLEFSQIRETSEYPSWGGAPPPPRFFLENGTSQSDSEAF